MTKPFTFGVQVGGTRDGADFRAHARKIEDLGYETFYLPDHFVDTAMAPMVGLAVAAEATTTLRVCALVLDNDYKHPAIVAKETATIDVLSGGRAELGIGAGWMKVDYDALGIPYDSAGTRIARLEEACAVIKGAWADGAHSFAGKHYTISEYDAIPKPTQRPGPPILIGGGGPKLLRLAGREADIVGINPNLRAGAVTNDAATDSVAENIDRKVGWIREGAGARFDDLTLQIRYFFANVTDDRQGLAEAMAPAFGLSPQDALDAGISLVGTVEEICDILVERRERWGVSSIVVGDDAFEAFAPVVGRLAAS
ncbi:MAG: TIGR03621 family F420-dependent LLM class oxidoreductase [Actinobacteria bacterium]|nr:TIGR03621 family F420-dependent LLM class oxidoreductase [Actinomycetota bacterium]